MLYISEITFLQLYYLLDCLFICLTVNFALLLGRVGLNKTINAVMELMRNQMSLPKYQNQL